MALSPDPRRIGAGKRVLVVEDELAVQTLVKRALRAQGFDVDTANDGLDALVRLELDRPDLIVTDIAMPRLDGMSMVKAIKAHPDTKAIPVIFLTARADTRSLIDGINVGARFYVTKPFQIEDLVSKVQKALKV